MVFGEVKRPCILFREVVIFGVLTCRIRKCFITTPRLGILLLEKRLFVKLEQSGLSWASLAPMLARRGIGRGSAQKRNARKQRDSLDTFMPTPRDFRGLRPVVIAASPTAMFISIPTRPEIAGIKGLLFA